MKIYDKYESSSDEKDIPYHLICPITSVMMSDPVIAEDGHTYERAALTSWIEKNPTSPITREPIGKMLIPNRGIKAAIAEYKEHQKEQAAKAPEPVDIEPLRQGLMASYQAQAHLHRIDDEVTPLPIDRCFVNLEIIRENDQKQEELNQIEQASDSSAHLINGSQSNKSTEQPREAIEIKSLLPDHQNRANKVMVYGRAGIGKSTLCRYIAAQWSAQQLWQDRFDWVIWIPLRTLTTKNYPKNKDNISAIDLIATSCFDHHEQRGLRKISNEAKTALRDHLATMTERTLIMLDGFDELDWQAATHLHTAFYQLMSFPNVILTSRPNYRVENVHMDTHLEITGFKPNEIRSFVQLFFANDPKAAAQCLNYLMSNDKLWGIAQIPINLELLCSVFRNNKLSTDQLSLTVVYQHLEFWLLHRAIERQGKFIPQANNPASYFARELALLSELAFKAMCQGKVLIPPELLNECKSYDEATLESARRLGFVKTIKEGLFFIHLTFQEYFAGRHVASAPLAEIAQTISALKYHSRLELVWWFGAGNLAKQPQLLTTYLDLLQSAPFDLIGIQALYLLVGCLEEAHVPLLPVTLRVCQQLTMIFQVVCEWSTFKMDCALSFEKYTELFNLASRLIQKNAHQFERIWLHAWHNLQPDDNDKAMHLVKILTPVLITPDILKALLKSTVLENSENSIEKMVIREDHLPILEAVAYYNDSSKNYNRCTAIYKRLEYHCLKSDEDIPADLLVFFNHPDDKARASAIMAIEHFGKPREQVLGLLEQALSDASSQVQVKALNTLKQFQVINTSAVRKIINALNHDQREVRLAALAVLATLPKITPIVEQALLQSLNTKDFSTLKKACKTLQTLKVSPEKVQNSLLPILEKTTDSMIKRSGIEAIGNFNTITDSVFNYLFSSLSRAEHHVNLTVIHTLGKIAKANPGAKSNRITAEFRRHIDTAMTTIDVSAMIQTFGQIQPPEPETLTCLKNCVEHKPYPVAQAAVSTLRQLGVSTDELSELFLRKLSSESFSSMLTMKIFLKCEHLPKKLIDRTHELISKYADKSYFLRDALEVIIKFDKIDPSLKTLIDTLDPDVKNQNGDSETQQIIFKALLRSNIKNPQRIVDMLSKRLFNEDDKPFGILIAKLLRKLNYKTALTLPALINHLSKKDNIFGYHHKLDTIKALGKLGRGDSAVSDALIAILDKVGLGEQGPHKIDKYILNAFVDLQIAPPSVINAYLKVLSRDKYIGTKRTIIAGFQCLLPFYQLTSENLATFAEAIASSSVCCTLNAQGRGQMLLGNRLTEFSYPPELSDQLRQAILQSMQKHNLSLSNSPVAPSRTEFFRAKPNSQSQLQPNEGPNNNNKYSK